MSADEAAHAGDNLSHDQPAAFRVVLPEHLNCAFGTRLAPVPGDHIFWVFVSLQSGLKSTVVMGVPEPRIGMCLQGCCCRSWGRCLTL